VHTSPFALQVYAGLEGLFRLRWGVPFTAFETEDIITDYQAMADAGYTAVGVYMRDDRCPFEMSQGLIAAGVKLWCVYEEGEPVSDAYGWNSANGGNDAARALAWAREHGVPLGKPIFAAVDYDAAWDIVAPYLVAFHNTLKSQGFLMGVYGSGSVCSWARDAGYAHYTWIAQSTGWGGYEDWLGEADIVQWMQPAPFGLSGDMNTVRNPAVLW
jgi:hypothetical protein